jgi:regulator of cell morphogenesis and NO signaling
VRKVGVTVSEIVRSLEEAQRAESPEGAFVDWQHESLGTLCAYIVDHHHSFARQELARLEPLLEKVHSKHGANHPELDRLKELSTLLRDELLPHMLKEEQVLFPYIVRLEENSVAGHDFPAPFFGSVRNPVKMMITEHEAAGDLLVEMRELTGNYLPPADACISYQTLYQVLRALESDLHQHIHLENNVLFPRAIATETQAHPDWQKAGKHQCFGHSSFPATN